MRATAYDLVLAMIRPGFEPAAIRALESTIAASPPAVLCVALERARVLEVGAIAATQLGSIPGGPPDVVEAARRLYAQNLARNLFLEAETDRWIAALGRQGVRCIPIKGPGWSRLLYGAIGAKACADVDLLVHEGDLADAGRVLAAGGLERLGAGSRDRWSKADTWEPRAESPLPYALDLHWRLEATAVLPLDVEDIWHSAESGPSLSERSLPLDLIGALLGAHVWRHAFTLKTLTDFAAFAMRYPEALPAVRARLARCGAGVGFDLALAASRRTLGVPGPGAGTRLGAKRICLPYLERWLHRARIERGRYAGYLVSPLQYDGVVRPIRWLATKIFRPDDAERADMTARVRRFAGALGRFRAARSKVFVRGGTP